MKDQYLVVVWNTNCPEEKHMDVTDEDFEKHHKVIYYAAGKYGWNKETMIHYDIHTLGNANHPYSFSGSLGQHWKI